MTGFSCVALFCEDVRVEASGQETLVGLFSDNLSIAELPTTMPKLAVYIRFNCTVDFTIENLSFKMILPNGSLVFENIVETAILEKSSAQANDVKSPTRGVKSIVTLSMFPVSEAGQYSLYSVVNGVDYLSGLMNILTGVQNAPASLSTTAWPPQP